MSSGLNLGESHSDGTPANQLLGDNRLTLGAILAHSVDHSSEIVGIADADGQILFVNEAFLRLTGRAANEFIGYHFGVALSPLTPPAVIEDIRVQGMDDGGWEGECLLRRRDGDDFPVFLTVGSIKSPSGRTTGMFACGHDISAEKRVVAELQRSESRYRRLFEAAHDGILILDAASGVIEDVNPFLIELLGFSKAELVGRRIWEIGPRRDVAQSRTRFEDLKRQTMIRYDDLPLQARDGRLIEVEVVSNSYSEGNATVMQCNIRDITERKRTEESLKLFRLLIDQSNDAIQVVDLESLRLIDVNARACSSLGYTREELLSLHVYDIDPAVDEPVRAKVIEDLRRSGSTIIQTIQRRKDGSTFPVEVSMKLVDLDRNYVVCALRDISERQQMERALEEVNAKLRVALGEAEEQAQEAVKLTELVDILQSCQTAEEAYLIIGNTLPATLSFPSGALCMTTPSRNLVEVKATWGDTVITEKEFAPDQCWALRRGKVHRGEGSAKPMRCAHVSESLAGGYTCIPLAAQGETLGVLCLQNPSQFPNPLFGSLEHQAEALILQARAVAERISLVLANLSVREVLRNQSIRDSLTGLFNRRFMEESLEREVRRAARNKEGLALLMLDLDHFKHFNDTFGHQAGDVLLRGFGEFLSQGTRGHDVVCRYGGEEFLIALSGTSVDAACERADLLREDLKQLTVRYAGQVLGSVTASIGVSAYPEHGATVEELVRAADKALYRAKKEGHDRVVVANPVCTGT